MARRDHFDDEEDRGFGSSGRRSSSYGEDSSALFNREADKREGKKPVLGMMLPAGIATGIDAFWNAFAGEGRRFVEKFSAPMIERASARFANPAQFRTHATVAVGLGTIFAKPIIESGAALAGAAGRMNALRIAMQPTMEAGGKSPLFGLFTSSGNEVIDDEREKVLMGLIEDEKRVGLSALPLLIHLGFWHQDHKEDLTKIAREEKIKGLSRMTPEQQANFWREEMGLSSDLLHSGPDMAKVAIQVRTEEWNKEYAAFKEKHGKEIIDKFKKEVGADNIARNRPLLDEHTAALRNYGLGEYRPDPMAGVTRNGRNRPNRQQRDLQRNRLEQAYERKIRGEFVLSNNGRALDDTWLADARFARANQNAFGGGGRGRYDDGYGHGYGGGYGHQQSQTPTIVQQTLKEVEEWNKLKRGMAENGTGKLSEEEKKSQRALFEKFSAIAATLAGNIVDHNVFGGEGAAEKYREPRAYTYIEHLRSVAAEARKNGEFGKVPALSVGKKSIGGGSLSRFLVDMVQTHLKQRHDKVHEAEFDHLAGVKFDDGKFLELPREKLTAFETLIAEWMKHIAKAQDMDPAALQDMLGDTRGRKLVQNGREFGPRGFHGGDEARKEAIVKAVDEAVVRIAGKVEMSETEKNDARAALALDEAETRKCFAEGDEAQRAFVLARAERFLPNKEDLCKLAGIPPEVCESLRKGADKEKDACLLAAAAQVANEWAEEGDEAWKKHGLRALSSHEKEALSHAGKAVAEGKDLVLSADAVELKAVSAVAAAVAVSAERWKIVSGRAEELEKTQAEEKEKKEKDRESPKAAKGRRTNHDRHEGRDEEMDFDGDDEKPSSIMRVSQAEEEMGDGLLSSRARKSSRRKGSEDFMGMAS